MFSKTKIKIKMRVVFARKVWSNSLESCSRKISNVKSVNPLSSTDFGKS